MAWFRMDDKFHSHPKVIGAGNAAVGLYGRCGSWSMDQGTEGKIPRHVARNFGTPKEIAALVANRLWLEVEDGYLFRDFLEYNPSNAEVAERRAVRAAAGAKGGLAKAKQTASNGEAKSCPSDVVANGCPQPLPQPLTTSTHTTNPPTAVSVEEGTPVDNRRSEVIRLYAIEAVKRGNPRSASAYMAKARSTIVANPELDRLLGLFPTAPPDVIANALHGEKNALGYWPRADELEPEGDGEIATVTHLRQELA